MLTMPGLLPGSETDCGDADGISAWQSGLALRVAYHGEKDSGFQRSGFQHTG